MTKNSLYTMLGSLAICLLTPMPKILCAAEPPQPSCAIERHRHVSLDNQKELSPFESLPDPVFQNNIAPLLTDPTLRQLVLTSKRLRQVLQQELDKRISPGAKYWSMPIQSRKIGLHHFVAHNKAITAFVVGFDFALCTLLGQMGEIRNLVTTIDEIHAVAFSPDGKTLASASGSIRLWDVATQKRLQTLALPDGNGAFTSVIFSPKGNILACVNAERLYICDAQTGDLIRTFNSDDDELYTEIAFSPNNQLLAVGRNNWAGRNNGKIDLFNTTTWEVKTLDSLQNMPISSVAFSHHGSYFAAASLGRNGHNGAICLWKWDSKKNTFKYIKTMHNEKEIPKLAFSPSDHGVIAYIERPGSLKLLNVKTLEEKKVDDNVLKFIHTFAISPDGNTIATGTLNYESIVNDEASPLLNTIGLYDVQHGHLLPNRLQGHKRGVVSLAFSPDGKTLASGSEDSRIRLWA